MNAEYTAKRSVTAHNVGGPSGRLGRVALEVASTALSMPGKPKPINREIPSRFQNIRTSSTVLPVRWYAMAFGETWGTKSAGANLRFADSRALLRRGLEERFIPSVTGEFELVDLVYTSGRIGLCGWPDAILHSVPATII